MAVAVGTSFICFILAAALAADGANDSSSSRHEIHFPQTDHELHIYWVYGREPGATVMIIGGIHGNEPGGYLAADKYVDLTLKKGNLIVVPRANLNSILTRERSGSGDYNRKFNTDLKKDNYDDQIIAILKELISESDLLLNLHDGSGFYRETYVDKMHNPYRFGQSVIADSESYFSAKEGRELRLGDIARRVVDRVNGQIAEEEYRFRFSNHDSTSPDTRYPEMRKTATYFALTRHQIPAYGIETSKSLPGTEIKLVHQVMVINSFLEEFGVEIDVPDRSVVPPKLEYAVVEINDDKALVVRDGGTIYVEPGDSIRVDHLVGNYERYMFADLQGYGGLNDNGREIEVWEPLSVAVRKDDRICGHFKVVPRSSRLAEESSTTAMWEPVFSSNFVVEVNGRRRLVPQGGELSIIRGDSLCVLDYLAPNLPKGINVNVLGFVGNPSDNRGEDRGYTINTARDLLSNWSLDGNGSRYGVAVKLRNRELERMTFRLLAPRLECLVIRRNDEHPVVLQQGERWNVRSGDRLTILGTLSSAPDGMSMSYLLIGPDGERKALQDGSFVVSSAAGGGDIDYKLAVMRGEIEIGSVQLSIETGETKTGNGR